MSDMKLILMIGDETWFWIWNDDTLQWEAFYEVGMEPAVRIPFSDRPNVTQVTEVMWQMADAAERAAEHHT